MLSYPGCQCGLYIGCIGWSAPAPLLVACNKIWFSREAAQTEEAVGGLNCFEKDKEDFSHLIKKNKID